MAKKWLLRELVKVKNSTVVRCARVLNKADRQKVVLVVFIQIGLSILDIVGVVIIGLLGSLTISGIGSNQPGDRVAAFLNFINLNGFTLQKQVAILGLFSSVILIGKTLVSVYFSRRILFFLSRRSAEISSILVSKLLGQDLLTIQKKSLQETMYAVTYGVNTVTVGVLGAAVSLIADTSLLLILGFSLFLVDTLVAISSLVMFSSIAFFLYRFMHVRVQKLGQKQAAFTVESQERISEVILGYRELFVKSRRHYYADRIGFLRLKLAESVAEQSFMQSVSKYVIEISVVVGSLLVGALQFLTQTASHAVAVLSIFLAASMRIAPAVLRVQQSLVGIKGSSGSASLTLELIDELQTAPTITKTTYEIDHRHLGFIPEVRIDSVSVKYPGSDRNALLDVSVSIKPGQVLAIVGPSGAGKTTLVDVLLGIIKPDSGTATISGAAAQETINLWPGALAYVPQNVVMLNGSIRENVCMGFEPDLNQDAKIYRALEIADLTNFVESLPNGLDSNIGDRGSSISGGQRQRLGIARALFTAPKLLVLDEATSALDGETELNISNAIQALKGEVTVVLIAHRLSTVREADIVLYLESGEVRGIGSFELVREQVPDFDRQAQLMGL